MTVNSVTWFAQMDEAARTGEVVAIVVDRATGKTTVRPIRPGDVAQASPHLDWNDMEAQAEKIRDRTTRGY